MSPYRHSRFSPPPPHLLLTTHLSLSWAPPVPCARPSTLGRALLFCLPFPCRCIPANLSSILTFPLAAAELCLGEMGHRKRARQPVKKKRPTVPKTFDCPRCHRTKCVAVSIGMAQRVAQLSCRVCQVTYTKRSITSLTAPVDVYYEWVETLQSGKRASARGSIAARDATVAKPILPPFPTPPALRHRGTRSQRPEPADTGSIPVVRRISAPPSGSDGDRPPSPLEHRVPNEPAPPPTEPEAEGTADPAVPS